MSAWQFVAGAGLVGALCPLHGHVAVADDGHGHGHGARVDLCTPTGQPRPPGARPSAPPAPAVPPVRATLPADRNPTTHHPGRAPGLTVARPEPGAPAGPAQPPAAGEAAGPQVRPAPGEAVAPPPLRAAAAPASAPHLRSYNPLAAERRNPNGLSTMMLMAVVTTPAVLAAAALRPRSKSRG